MGGVAESFARFAAVTLVLAGLAALASQPHAHNDDGGVPHLPDSLARLLDELPSYVVGLIGGEAAAEQGDDIALSGVVSDQLRSAHPEKALKRSLANLKDWIRNGMHQVTSATE